MSASSRAMLSLAVKVSVALYLVMTFFLMQNAHIHSPQDVAALLSQRKQEFLGDSNNIINSGTKDATQQQQKQPTTTSSIINELHRPVTEILSNPKLPDWVKNYVKWHQQQRRKYFDDMRVNGKSNVRFLISRCLTADKCGGASDRLQDIPYNFMLANQTNRVLLVRWEKPAKLENFLIPPEGGIDWTVPDDMFPKDADWKSRDEHSGRQIVSRIRGDSLAPKFKNYEKTVLGGTRM